MTKKELSKILKDNKSDLRVVNLSDVDLSNANLSGMNLSYVNFSNSNLSGVNFSNSNLSYANFSNANLSYVNFRGADLSNANFSDVNSIGADLSGADLSGANFSGAKTDKMYIQISCVGSQKRMTTYCFDDDIIWCGCWSGSLQEFKERVKTIHKNNPKYLAEYQGFIKYIKYLKEMMNNERLQ